MSSSRTKLKNKIDLTAKQLNAPMHGCEECRSTERRTEAVNELVESGKFEVCIQCSNCLARWNLLLYPKGPQQEMHAKFTPSHVTTTGGKLN